MNRDPPFFIIKNLFARIESIIVLYLRLYINILDYSNDKVNYKYLKLLQHIFYIYTIILNLILLFSKKNFNLF